MNWDAIGAVGEIVGAIAVFVSIIYLARQINNANKATEASTTLDSTRLLSDWHQSLNQSPGLADIFVRGMEDASALTNIERASFLAAVADLFTVLEGLYRQHNLGFLPEETWVTVEEFLDRAFASEAVAIWWESRVSVNGRVI